MKIVLENIGMLKHAEMDLLNLSVIAGENDNGKSTVGKVVFCVIKAINRYKEDLEESKEFKINEAFDSVFFEVRRNAFSFSKLPSSFRKINSIRDKEFPVEKRVGVIYEIMSQLGEEDASVFEKLVIKQVNEIKRLSTEPENINKSIENALNKVFYSEFDGSVLYSGKESGAIRFYEGKLKLIDIRVDQENRFKLLGDVEPIELKDATFIETPLILNNHDLLIRSQSGLNVRKRSVERLGIPYTTLHTKDLFDKLVEPSIADLFDVDEDVSSTLFSEISSLVNGSIIYNGKKRDFIFKKDDNEISIKNTASGIKMFGLLQLLSRNGFLAKDSIFIFDEPENHLHPKWQLKLAEILVALSGLGIYVLVSSHSPYMIEAIKRFSEKLKLDDSLRFYFSENNIIENVDKLEAVFNALAEPFEIFRKMDAEALKDE